MNFKEGHAKRSVLMWKKGPISSKEVRFDLVIGSIVVLLLLGANIVLGSQVDWPVLRDLTYPGFALAAAIPTTAEPTNAQWVSMVFILGSCFDILLYSVLIFLFRRVLPLTIPRTRSRARETWDGEFRGHLFVSAVQAVKTGFLVALGLLILVLLLPNSIPEWPFAVGNRTYKALFGNPSHGAGGVYAVSVLFINAIFYSALIFAVRRIFERFVRNRSKV